MLSDFTQQPARRIGGIAFIVMALMCFGALHNTTKVASTAAPVLMAIWARYLAQVAVSGVFGTRPSQFIRHSSVVHAPHAPRRAVHRNRVGRCLGRA